MSKVAHYLQEHLLGEVSTSADARRFFSTDNSIFSVVPSMIVYPRNENDVRKTARFAWQLAERKRIIPITARGAGTDLGGAALGSGIILSFPAHMNRIIQLDTKSGNITVEPGLNYGRLQQTLHTHERFLPPYPASMEYSTIGGAVANNASGERAVKYGSTKEFVSGLRVVLANGEVITTKRLSKRELNKKLGLSTFEGEIYRTIDSLIEENKSLVDTCKLDVAKNTAGYNIADVKHKDGSFDLTPLFVNSQGTLGIITEITMATEPYNPETTLFLASFDSISSVTEAILDLRHEAHVPSVLELVDGNLLKFIERLNPNQLKGSLEKPYPRYVLLVEFDESSDRQRKKAVKKAKSIFDKLASHYEMETDLSKQSRLWKVRHATSSLLAHSEKQLKAIPLIDDCAVPLDKLGELITEATKLFAAEQLQLAMWGHAGDGSLHIHPFFDLSSLGDRQRAFRLLQSYYQIVTKLGGTTSSQHGDGRIRAPFLTQVYSEDAVKLLEKLKHSFDPHGILNPGVKLGVSIDDLKPLVREHYSLNHLYNHMPRS